MIKITKLEKIENNPGFIFQIEKVLDDRFIWSIKCLQIGNGDNDSKTIVNLLYELINKINNKGKYDK